MAKAKGFAAMSKAMQKQIASMGGKASHKGGGGLTSSANRRESLFGRPMQPGPSRSDRRAAIQSGQRKVYVPVKGK